MPLPHLHIVRPSVRVAPHLATWVNDVIAYLESESEWAQCKFSIHECNEQAHIDAATVSDKIRRSLGPVIAIHKIQYSVIRRLEDILNRRTCVYQINPSGPDAISAAFERARLDFEGGEPRIPQLEAIAYLIIRKLYVKNMWAGTALNKNFLWASDLPNGGFPAELLEPRLILQVADVLYNGGLLARKRSEGKWKYGLDNRQEVEKIVLDKAFNGFPKLSAYFLKSDKYVPATCLDFNSDE